MPWARVRQYPRWPWFCWSRNATFGVRRLCHRFRHGGLTPLPTLNLVLPGCDRSQPTKAVTGHRTPKCTARQSYGESLETAGRNPQKARRRTTLRDEIAFFIDGVTSGTIADYQISALLMAIYLNGMNDAEQELLTHAMLHSGNTLDFSNIDKPKADKHSTGGVGDKTSLLIAPMVAACGVCVPMISGRGLGHTGGTLDKLESIPGYRVDLSATEFENVLKTVGYAMSGQTAELAPADKKMYALRDAPRR